MLPGLGPLGAAAERVGSRTTSWRSHGFRSCRFDSGSLAEAVVGAGGSIPLFSWMGAARWPRALSGHPPLDAARARSHATGVGYTA